MLQPHATMIGLTLYSHQNDYICHRVRLALADKQISYQLILIDDDDDDMQDQRDDIADLSPYNTLPLLVEKEFKLYHPMSIFEYLDERYPQHKHFSEHPHLRAMQRQNIWRLEEDWLRLAHTMLKHPDSFDKKEAELARKQFMDMLNHLMPVFKQQPFFMSQTYSILDCLIAPIFWRLEQMNIKIHANANTQHFINYCKVIFERPSFKKSLTPQERILSPKFIRE